MRARDVVGRKIVGVAQSRKAGKCFCGHCHEGPWDVYGFYLDDGGWLQINPVLTCDCPSTEAAYHPPKKETA